MVASKSKAGTSMAAQVRFERGPALSAVAPFFLAAPLGLVAAGIFLAQSNSDVFVAINLPRLVAVTHAIVLGWITATIMGATYQLGPVVLGGRLLSTRLMRIQFAVHVAAVALFVWTLLGWRPVAMGWAGSLLVVSLLLYIVNAGTAVFRAKQWTLSRMYLATSLGFLAVTGGFGITYVGALQHPWFPITFGRLAAHAHLGLVGWLALTLMGISYQLVPMFNVTVRVQPRFGRMALANTAGATVLFAGAMLFDPPPQVRLPLALLLAAGPLLWGVDQLRLVRARSKRRLDIQGRATLVSLTFLAVAAVLGAGAAIGTPFTPAEEPARWALAYGAAAILGWAGCALIGNAFKIMAFLVWIHRYHPRAGIETVPAVADLYDARLATAILVLHAAATAGLIVGALIGNLDIFRLGGMLLAVSGTAFIGGLASMFAPHRARVRTHAPGGIPT